MTIAVCISPADWGSNSKPHTTCATGQGESFSICSSTIACVSAASLLGNWITRKKTLSEASQAMFSFGRNSVCQSLPTILAGSGSVGRLGSCRWRANLAENCQSWWTWLPGWSTLQECQRAILTPHQRFGAAVVHQRFEVLFDLRDTQNLLDGRPSRHDLVPTIQAQGSHAMVDGPLRNGRGGGAAQNQRAKRFVQNQNLVDALPALVTQLPALLATHPLPELRRLDVCFRKADFPQELRLDFPFRAAVRANIAHQALGHDRLDHEATRNGSMPMSINRVKALGASFVCSVLNTRCPVNAARMAISAVSKSRISPTMITFGSWRRMWRSPIANVSPMSERTAIWLIPLSSYSTGSSMVMIRFCTELIVLKNA